MEQLIFDPTVGQKSVYTLTNKICSADIVLQYLCSSWEDVPLLIWGLFGETEGVRPFVSTWPPNPDDFSVIASYKIMKPHQNPISMTQSKQDFQLNITLGSYNLECNFFLGGGSTKQNFLGKYIKLNLTVCWRYREAQKTSKPKTAEGEPPKKIRERGFRIFYLSQDLHGGMELVLWGSVYTHFCKKNTRSVW